MIAPKDGRDNAASPINDPFHMTSSFPPCRFAWVLQRDGESGSPTSRTTRKPRLTQRLWGVLKLRNDERAKRGKLFHPPPRRTRTASSSSGPRGSSSGDLA